MSKIKCIKKLKKKQIISLLAISFFTFLFIILSVYLSHNTFVPCLFITITL
uniref:Uncharacterized protein n=1 Tax=Octopus bimaculoides TaxID=37653 RepID=A0A0L8FXX6_OCTBM